MRTTLNRNDDLVLWDGDFARFPGLRWRHPDEA